MSTLTVQPFSFRDLTGDLPAGSVRRHFTPSGNKAKAEAPPEPPAPPSFDEEQMKEAERDGYRKGFLEGETEGRKQAESEQAGVDRALTQMAEQFVAGISPLLADYRRMALALRKDTTDMALAIAKKAAGVALTEGAAQVVEEAAVAACEAMIAEPKITVTVQDDLANRLQARLHELVEKMQAATDIVVIGDPAMPVADCRIEWHHGAMQRSGEQVWQAIERAMGGVAAGGMAETQKELAALEKQMNTVETDVSADTSSALSPPASRDDGQQEH